MAAGAPRWLGCLAAAWVSLALASGEEVAPVPASRSERPSNGWYRQGRAEGLFRSGLQGRAGASSARRRTPGAGEDGPVRVVLHGRERPDEVAVSGGASLGCDGRPVPAAAAWTLRREGGRVRLVERERTGTARECRRVSVSAPEGLNAGGHCRGRAAFSLRAGTLQRCHEGTLEVRAQGNALHLVLMLPLERYVASVLVSEAGDAPAEALAAQAVVTRTWALAHRGRHGSADACDLTHCQLYRGEQAPHADAAAARTAGQVLRHGGEPVPAFFHAACGGHTAEARAVFGVTGRGASDGERGPVAVADVGPDGRPWCAEAPWHFELARRALAEALRLPPRGSVRVLGRTVDGRVREVEAFGRVMGGPRFVAEVTRALGYGTLKGARFRVQQDGEVLRFEGEGRGHGVGFCQVGAAARARAGQGYEALLHAYFPAAEVSPPRRAIPPAP